jgi:hypothetical protein
MMAESIGASHASLNRLHRSPSLDVDATHSSTVPTEKTQPSEPVQPVDIAPAPPPRPPPISAVERTRNARRGGGNDLSSQLANYVEGMIRNADSDYNVIMKKASQRLPSAPGIPGADELRDTMEMSLNMMATSQNLFLTINAGDMVRSTVKSVTDKALEMKE